MMANLFPNDLVNQVFVFIRVISTAFCLCLMYVNMFGSEKLFASILGTIFLSLMINWLIHLQGEGARSVKNWGLRACGASPASNPPLMW